MLKKKTALLVLLLLLLPGLCAASPVTDRLAKVGSDLDASARGSMALKILCKKELVPLCTLPALIDAAKVSNAKQTSLEAIKKLDQEWIDAEEPLEIMDELQNNACGKALQSFAAKNHLIAKGFVFDNQGATVGSHSIPNDYWQGDEGKYRKTVQDKSIEIGPVKFDKAENRQLQHVALPLIDTDGTVVGGVLIGIFIDKL
ncbi:MAG: PDC sensor domain-containing protein [Desulfobacterales bacterium]|nr:PDC sensor domain-containing protein [Desulfobacterales bacterium]